MDMSTPGYASLQNVLQRAFDQAARTKGAERHANELPFDRQPMQTIADKHGPGFIFGQIDKKSLEAHGMVKRGEHSKAVHELLGVINYAAGAIIHIEKNMESGPLTDEPQVTERDTPADALREALGADSVTIVTEEGTSEDDIKEAMDGVMEVFRLLGMLNRES